MRPRSLGENVPSEERYLIVSSDRSSLERSFKTIGSAVRESKAAS
jgi:hypothetical protein